MNKSLKLIFLLISINLSSQASRLLFVFFAKECSDKFFKSIDLCYKNLSLEHSYNFMIFFGQRNFNENYSLLIEKLNKYPNLQYFFSQDFSKKNIISKEINKYADFDIVTILNDNIEEVTKSFDKIIVDNMTKHFPQFDGVINFTRLTGNYGINFLPAIGKNYLNDFENVYCPEYRNHFYAAKEFTNISRILKKEKCSDDIVFKACIKLEEGAVYLEEDKKIFLTRQLQNFFLDQNLISKATPKDWSILIPTLESRSHLFDRVYNQITDQIKKAELQDRVEVLYFKDNRENTIGFKRNWLLQNSNGKYVNFVDDDDLVSDNFITLIHSKLMKDPDCVMLLGQITFNGHNPKKFIHSVNYNIFFEKDNVYYRPPNHLSPMKRDIAVQFLFPEINMGEDTDWAMQICNSGLLKKEEEVESLYYFYLYVSSK